MINAENKIGSIFAPIIFVLKFSIYKHLLSMMLDDTRGGLDVSSLHRDTSMDISLYKKFRLLSCHRDTSIISKYKTKQKLRSCLLSFFIVYNLYQIL